MSGTFDKQTIMDVLTKLSNRIARLERGGRPLAAVSEITSLAVITLAAGVSANFTAELEWPNPDVPAVLGAVPYIRIYVDVDGEEDNLFPNGSALTSGQKNLQLTGFLDLNELNAAENKSTFRGVIKNNDSISHSYYIDVAFTYLAGASSSQ